MRVLLSILFLLSTSSSTAADDTLSDSHRQAAVELLQLLDLERTMMGGASAMADAMIQQNPMLAPYRDVLLEWVGKFMTWETFQPRFVALYAEAYSENELYELIDFYRTPTGRKTIELMPELMRRGALLGSEVAAEHSADLQEMIKTRAAELENFRPSE